MDTQPENLTRRRLIVGTISLLLVSAREVAAAEPATLDEPQIPDDSLEYYRQERRYCFYRYGRRVCVWR